MDFTALQTEFFARGFDYLNDAGAGLVRAKRFINQSYLEICEMDDWGFLQASSSGSSPLTVADLGRVESVFDDTNDKSLTWKDRRDLIELDPALTLAGSPTFYYITSNTIVTSWPTTSVTLNVKYWKVPTELSAGGDTPLIPSRYQYSIVDYAAARAYMDNDNPTAAANARAEGDRLISLMRESLIAQQRSSFEVMTVYGDMDG